MMPESCTCPCVDPGSGWPDPQPPTYEPSEDCVLHGFGAPQSAFSDHPTGCTCTWCVPTPEQSAEVAEMLRQDQPEGGAF